MWELAENCVAKNGLTFSYSLAVQLAMATQVDADD
jgi:hypothetical protein